MRYYHELGCASRIPRPTKESWGGHVPSNIVGAVNSAYGQLVSLVFPHCDTKNFKAFLNAMDAEAPARIEKRILLVLENGRRLELNRLDLHHIEPVFLLPYSPDLNPFGIQ